MQIRLLGNVDVSDVGAPVPVPGERRRSVLATLALRPGATVSIDKIIDAVWADEPPATARNTVQCHIAYLRKVMRTPSSIVSRPPGYVLIARQAATDIQDVEALLTQAGQLDQPLERIAIYEQALACWRGTPLADVGDSPYLLRQRDLFTDLQVSTSERKLADQLRVGRHRDTVAELEALVAEFPFRERLTQMLMTALYRCGRGADALRAYRRLDATLADELGVRPGHKVASAYRQIADGDTGLLQPGGPTARPRSSPGRPPTPAEEPSTPSRSTPYRTVLVGRDAEREQCLRLLEATRLLSIVGMGGVGKTRLAWAVADAVATQGTTCLAVDLVAATPECVDTVVAAALSLADMPGESMTTQLLARVGGGNTLLILDTCDAVVPAVATLVSRLLATIETLRVVITSCEPLQLEGEACVLLAPLVGPASDPPTGRHVKPAPAVAMLADRASRADATFELGPANRPAINQLCQHVGGLPLALEIIGLRLRSLTATELAENAEHICDWQHRAREVPDRHRSVGARMEWSYSLLSAAEAAALDRLSSVPQGLWFPQAAQACSDELAEGQEILLRLIDRSLVVRAESHGRSRVSVHALVRAYAQQRRVAQRSVADSGAKSPS